MKTKRCSKCKIERPINEFYKNKLHKDGLTSHCKECQKEYVNKYRQRPEIKEQVKEYHKKYYQQPEVKKKQKEYWQRPEVKKRHKKYYREYRQQNKKQIKEYYQRPDVKERQREYSQKLEVKERHREYTQKYLQRPEVKEYQQRPEIIKKRRKYMRKYRKLTRHTNPQIRLSHVISSTISNSLKGNKNGRHWEDLVGYTLQDLKIHLEKQFDLFMNWENQGSYWHIDHIKPKSLFNFTHPEDPEFKDCWALNNLQPLESGENIRKGNKYIKE